MNIKGISVIKQTLPKIQSFLGCSDKYIKFLKNKTSSRAGGRGRFRFDTAILPLALEALAEVDSPLEPSDSPATKGFISYEQ